MKKFLVAALALVCSGSAFAIDNEPEEGLSTQVFLGMTTSSIQNLNSFDGKVGGTAGIKFDYMLPNAHGTYINAGLDWIMKGAKMSYKNDFPVIGTTEVTTKIPTHYIELPVHVGFRYNVMQDLGVYGEVGPYFAFGVGGNNKVSLDADGSEVAQYESSYSIFKKAKDRVNFQRWDAGFGFRVGCEYMNHYSLNLGCDWGFTDMWRDSYRDAAHDAGVKLDKIKNFAFNLSFGYRF
ncbi:MAG: PorT family protein [Bacteroidales bacterium]|nr:PorT family protein [Bacteroidales bacterium]